MQKMESRVTTSTYSRQRLRERPPRLRCIRLALSITIPPQLSESAELVRVVVAHDERQQRQPSYTDSTLPPVSTQKKEYMPTTLSLQHGSGTMLLSAAL